MSNRIDRARDLGNVGSWLLEMLTKMGDYPEQDNLVSQVTQLSEWEIKGVPALVRAAYSLLECDVVVQVGISDDDVLDIVRRGLSPLEGSPKQLYLGKNQKRRPTFLSKSTGPAEKKTNLRFGDVWRDFQHHRKKMSTEVALLSGHMLGMTDDQATCVLLAAEAWCDIPDAVPLAIRMVKDPTGAKSITSILKGLGANGSKLGSRFVEGNVLIGRGADEMDLREQALLRVQEPGAAGSVVDADEVMLRVAVRSILLEEIDLDRVEVDDPKEFWEKRWLWCVNGGHSRALDKVQDGVWRINMPGRLHRRAAMENWDLNPLDVWRGDVLVSASVKQEHGKDRMILACDTLSYVAFEHLSKPVERAWRNKRVLLDPGRLGHAGMCDRVRALGHAGAINLMLDYDDFNSQHSLESQKIVVDEIVRYINYDKDMGRRLVESFDKMQVHVGGDRVGRAKATLMSGHRCTTLINSILNAAYIRMATGRAYRGLNVLHTGDDVVAAVSSYHDVVHILDGCNALKLRMNPLKQSVGRITAEFLRVAIKPEYSTGYVLRSIAASVSGNWVNPSETGKGEALQTMVSNARSLMNRARNSGMAALLCTAVRRKTGLKGEVVRGLLTGRVTVEGGPVFSRDRMYRAVRMYWPKDEDKRAERMKELESKATTDYLTSHVSEIETYALVASGSSPKTVMLDSSYGKTLAAEDEVTVEEQVRVGIIQTRAARGSEVDTVVRKRQIVQGRLTKYPLLYLIKARLGTSLLRELLKMVGWSGKGDPREAAWGTEGCGAIVDGITSMSDAANLCKRTLAGVVEVSRPCYV
uniref:RNA-directed RNA polymerase n=1 Tax=Red algae totivirus 1 TaxID=2706914 RepID=A0A6J4BT32_9VIRU|nr:RNA dependent RNA polymerase [Red algae totivirus 1]